MAGEFTCAGAIGYKNTPKALPNKAKRGYERDSPTVERSRRGNNFVEETPNNSNTSAGNSLKTPKSPESRSNPLSHSLYAHVPPVFAIRSLKYKPLVRAVEYIENFNCPPHVLWDRLWVVICDRGVEVAGKLSEPPRFGAKVPQPTQPHQNGTSILTESHYYLLYIYIYFKKRFLLLIAIY
jgi:hypothetical protein